VVGVKGVVEVAEQVETQLRLLLLLLLLLWQLLVPDRLAKALVAQQTESGRQLLGLWQLREKGEWVGGRCCQRCGLGRAVGLVQGLAARLSAGLEGLGVAVAVAVAWRLRWVIAI